MTHVIRKAMASDMDAIYTIEQQAHIAPWSREILDTCLSAGYDFRVIVTASGKNDTVMGYIIVRYHKTVAHVLNFCIAQSFQLKGYGRKLLETVLSSLPEHQQIQSVVLEVRPTNTIALHLYESLGFTCIEVKKGYYTDANEGEDALRLQRLIE
jgi:[ribosomal protein S18]-alanine N-acetyltransferase